MGGLKIDERLGVQKEKKKIKWVNSIIIVNNASIIVALKSY